LSGLNLSDVLAQRQGDVTAAMSRRGLGATSGGTSAQAGLGNWLSRARASESARMTQEKIARGDQLRQELAQNELSCRTPASAASWWDAAIPDGDGPGGAEPWRRAESGVAIAGTPACGPWRSGTELLEHTGIAGRSAGATGQQASLSPWASGALGSPVSTPTWQASTGNRQVRRGAAWPICWVVYGNRTEKTTEKNTEPLFWSNGVGYYK